MAARPDLESAASISVVGCEACPCGRVHVRMHDAQSEIFAVASMPPDIARRFHAELGQQVPTLRGAPGLSTIRCEGSA